MIVSELIPKLQQLDPEDEIITTAFNGQVRTYALVDFVLQLDYDGVYSDLFGTPGPTDDRLLKLTSKHLVSIDTLFKRNEH